jgi:hypothetical protein
MVVENVDGTELKFKNPGRLLLVVIGFLFWAVGFIDLIGHTSADPDVFGLYSLPFFILIILYASTIVIWFLLFFNSKILSRVADGVRYIQNHVWLALPILAGLGIALWIIFEWDRWSRLPGLQVAALGLVLLTGFIILFTNWDESNGKQRWRRLIGYLLIALVAVEVLIQLVAYLGFLPGVHTIGGDYTPYERVYHNAEGYRNGYANRYGWYYPDSELEDESHRILILGGSNVQALQVSPEDQFTALLPELINQGQVETGISAEVISIGLPGFGPSPYLYEEFLSELLLDPGIISVDEIIVLLHLGNDFQSPETAINPIVYTVDETGGVDVHRGSAKLRHDLTHYFMRSYLSFQPVEILRGNYLTPRVIDGLFSSWRNAAQASSSSTPADSEIDFPRLRGSVTSTYAINEPGHAGIKSTEQQSISYGNNFIFKLDDDQEKQDSIAIVNSLLATAQEFAIKNDITFRVVTIPVFPEAFFDQFQGDNWEPQMGGYDLFQPERILIEIAQSEGIPLLPMGHYMSTDKLNVEAIRSLHYSNGQGHFTPVGHEYYANAIYECFFADTENDRCSQ